MGGQIGAINFPYNLYFVDKFKSAPLRHDQMGFDGTIMSITVASAVAEIVRVVRFDWINQWQLNKLREYTQTGEQYTLDLGNGEQFTIRFPARNALTYRPVVPEDGFVHGDVYATQLDLYNGEFKVYVDSKYATGTTTT